MDIKFYGTHEEYADAVFAMCYDMFDRNNMSHGEIQNEINAILENWFELNRQYEELREDEDVFKDMVSDKVMAIAEEYNKVYRSPMGIVPQNLKADLSILVDTFTSQVLRVLAHEYVDKKETWTPSETKPRIVKEKDDGISIVDDR